MADMKEVEDAALKFVRSAVERAVWNVVYHEDHLAKERKILKGLQAIIKEDYPEINFDAIKRDREYDDEDLDEEGEFIYKDLQDYLEKRICVVKNSIEYHEKSLISGNTEIGLVRLMLARGILPKIDIEAVFVEQRKKNE